MTISGSLRAWMCLLAMVLSIAHATEPQANSDAHNRVSSQQSITVEANSTPEEKEEGDLNDIYQPVSAIQQQHDCQSAIDKYRAVVIPAAERAKFPKPKNKYLYLAYRGIGDCEMNLKNFAEAEATYQKLFEYLPVWPGTDDSDYPIAFQSLGYARMAQQKWTDAEEPLRKSISILDDMIASASKSDKDFVRNEMANDYRMSEDSSLYFLGVVYYREKRDSDALGVLERGYNQALQYHAPAPIVKNIVDAGVTISVDSLDVSAGLTWSKRALSLK